ncbi:hypothetical protein C0Z18_04355 [Trinickia dabaoshanensis]|uniref:Uncharacterized protein n=1 Tax=Trinickia dabaoshanensis TaxID=564714 RepID=A0A2N7VZJ8_9BURK|nr:hypothetical protein C0Z18_04355 [Trinickia dabaoshanensis]
MTLSYASARSRHRRGTKSQNELRSCAPELHRERHESRRPPAAGTGVASREPPSLRIAAPALRTDR